MKKKMKKQSVFTMVLSRLFIGTNYSRIAAATSTTIAMIITGLWIVVTAGITVVIEE